MNIHQIDNEKILSFMTAGKALITIVNTTTGNHFTYSIDAPSEETEKGGIRIKHEADIRFVKVLTGPDNENDYRYAGFFKKVFPNGWMLIHGGQKSKIGLATQSWKALCWVINRVNHLPENVQVLHNGYCGRCGRLLTNPESLEIGIGPDCLEKMI